MIGNTGGLANGTFVWTPQGFSRVEDLRPGDFVIGGDGSPRKVVVVAAQPTAPCMVLGFDRGLKVRCSAGQQWLALHPAARYPTRHSHGKVEANPRFNRWQVFRASEIAAASGAFPIPRRRFLIPSSGIVQMQAKEVPIDPYLLGVLLGDGCFRAGSTMISSADPEILESVALLLPHGLSVRHTSRYDYSLVLPGGRGHGHGGTRRSGRGNPLTFALVQLGLHGLLSHQKFVPEIYLFNSASVRLGTLQGLMDTDGGVAPTQGAMEFSTTSPYLASAVEFLVASFGGKCFVERRTTRFTNKFGERQDGMESFRLRIRIPQVTPFRLNRKVARLVRPVSTCDERVLWSIEGDGASACTSLAIDHPDHTFLVDRGIVVHDCTVPGIDSGQFSAFSKLLHPTSAVTLRP